MYETIHEITYRIGNDAESWGAVFIGDKSFAHFKTSNRDLTILSHKTRKWLK